MPCIAVGCDGDFDEGPSSGGAHEEPRGVAAETAAAAASKSASSACTFSGDTSSAPWFAGSRSADAEEDGDEEDAAEEQPVEAPPPAPRSFIILDIDGVLNTRSDPRLLSVEEAPCARLRQLLDASGAELVLSTPWRRHHQYVLEVLVKFGVFKHGEAPQELARTPSHASEGRRDLEILQWLGARRGEVGAWAVLDAGDLLQRPSAARLQGHVVRPAPGEGLTAATAEEVLRVLGVSGGLPAAAGAAAGRKAAEAEAAASPGGAVLDDSFGGVSVGVTSIAAPGGSASSTATGAPRFANAGVTTQALEVPSTADVSVSFGDVSVSVTSVAAPAARASAAGAGAPRFASAGVFAQADCGDSLGPRFANAGVSTQADVAPTAPTPAEASGLSTAFRGIGAWDNELEAKMRDLLGALAPSPAGPADAAGAGRDGAAGARGGGGGEFDDVLAQLRGRFSAK